MAVHRSPALAPPPGNPRFGLLDSVRGLAAVAVVYAHSYNVLHERDALFSHGYWDNLANTLGVAVQVFFALSGFLLVRPYLAAFARGERGPSVRAFLRRRVLRIIPAYWVALTLTAIFVPAAASGAFSEKWWLFYGFGQVYALDDIHQGLAVAWSLSVEATFYALIPAIAWLMRRAGAGRVIAGMFVLGVVCRVANSVDLGNAALNELFARIVYGFPGQAPFFAIGMLLALWSVRGRPSWLDALVARPVATWAGALAAFMATAAVFSFANPIGGLDFRFRFLGYYVMTAVVVLLILVPAVYDERPSPVRWLLARREVVFVGVVSYGLYLWHVPLEQRFIEDGLMDTIAAWPLVPGVALTFGLVLVGSLFTATISYYVVELPFLRLKEPRRMEKPLPEEVNRDSLLREDAVPTH